MRWVILGLFFVAVLFFLLGLWASRDRHQASSDAAIGAAIFYLAASALLALDLAIVAADGLWRLLT